MLTNWVTPEIVLFLPFLLYTVKGSMELAFAVVKTHRADPPTSRVLI
jgi:hypothetical protein